MDLLDGVRILDFTQHQAGPYGTALLADFGAEVIKIERPGGDPARTNHPDVNGVNAFFLANNRGKKSLCLDLAKPAAIEIVERLVGCADVLAHNLKPGAMERLGLGHQRLRSLNPRLVYAEVSTYGPRGSRREETGVDLIAQAESGVMSVTGLLQGSALPVGVAIADALGGVNLAFAVMSALYARTRTGEGQIVQISLVGGLLGLQAWELQHHLLGGASSGRGGRSHPLIKTLWQSFTASDGDLVIAEVKDSWAGICRAIGRPELAADERFRSVGRRYKNRAALLPILEQALRSDTVAGWVKRLRAEGVLAAPVRDYAGIAADPDTLADGYIRTVEHPEKGTVPVSGPFLHFPQAPPRVRGCAPRVGEHSTEILHAVGYTAPEIERLCEEGAAFRDRPSSTSR
jgi:crotonobetainyl-CoA:carnitine CoA-transferase CaiB-like acyl-CoA transferase